MYLHITDARMRPLGSTRPPEREWLRVAYRTSANVDCWKETDVWPDVGRSSERTRTLHALVCVMEPSFPWRPTPRALDMLLNTSRNFTPVPTPSGSARHCVGANKRFRRSFISPRRNVVAKWSKLRSKAWTLPIRDKQTFLCVIGFAFD